MRRIYLPYILGILSAGAFALANAAIAAPQQGDTQSLEMTPAPDTLPTGSTNGVGIMKDERDRVLSKLQSEIEPHLPKADVEELNHSLMRLGSYRRDWREKGREKVLANFQLAEYFIYRLSLAKNERLNHEFLKLFLAAQSPIREPKAVVAFMEILTGNSVENKKLGQAVLEKAVNQTGSVLGDAVNLLNSDWARDLPVDSKAFFVMNTCKAARAASVPLLQQARSFVDAASTFWGHMAADEVRSCLAGV